MRQCEYCKVVKDIDNDYLYLCKINGCIFCNIIKDIDNDIIKICSYNGKTEYIPKIKGIIKL